MITQISIDIDGECNLTEIKNILENNGINIIGIDTTASWINKEHYRLNDQETYYDIIEKRAKKYERYELTDDEEIEISNLDGEIFICKYSEKRKGSEPLESVCKTKDINLTILRKLCDEFGWYYVL